MAFITVNTHPLYFDHNNRQEGPALLLIHGSGGSHAHWPESLRNWKGGPVFAPDLPEHGASGGHGQHCVDAYADIIADFARKLSLTHVTAVGHSLGGAIVQTLALRSPDWLSRIVLVGTGGRLKVHPQIMDGLVARHDATLQMICGLCFARGADPAVAEKVLEGFLDTPAWVTQGDFTACNHFDVMERLADIRLPTLIISADADQMTPVKYGEYLNRSIPGSRLHIMKNAGHMMALEQPEAFLKTIVQFLTTP